jgi:hypothetical protein
MHYINVLETSIDLSSKRGETFKNTLTLSSINASMKTLAISFWSSWTKEDLAPLTTKLQYLVVAVEVVFERAKKVL